MSALVAVTTSSLEKGGSHGRRQVLLYADYLSVLERVGLVPVLLTPAHAPASVRALLEVCAGLVLTGGEDVDPRRYGERPIEQLGEVSPERDEMEATALALALERDLPVLGICRGCQMLNVHFGGTLYQDLAVQRAGALAHEQNGGWSERAHELRLTSGSRLRRALGEDALRVNSFHHQAIKQLGAGLELVAEADDGVGEGIEARDRTWVVGVQWHPERQRPDAPDSDPDRRLFAAFREAVLARAAAGRAA